MKIVCRKTIVDNLKQNEEDNNYIVAAIRMYGSDGSREPYRFHGRIL